MSPPLVLGIDPGLAGGIAALRGTEILELADMPVIRASTARGVSRREILPGELADLLRGLVARVHGATEFVAVVERQQAYPKQGATSGFRTGYGAGIVVGVLSSLRIPFEWIEAPAWKRAVGIPPKSDKGRSIELAQRLYPTAEIGRHDGRADALLIARARQLRAPGAREAA